MRTSLLIILSLLAVTGTNAQTLQEIVAKTDNELYDNAGNDLRVLISRNPAKGEFYYYYA